MKTVYYTLILITLIVISGYIFYIVECGHDTNALVAIEPQINMSDSDNLLTHSIKHNTTNTLDWRIEISTAGTPAFALSPYNSALISVPNGTQPQRMIYNGVTADNVTGKLETFLIVHHGVVSGDVLNFSVDLSGKLVNTPTVVGIESFDDKDNYIDSTDSYVTDVSEKPSCYNVIYTCPKNTSYLAVYVQCQEINPKSVISLTLSKPRLIREPPGYVEPRKVNSKNTDLFIYVILFLIPSIVIISEFIVSIRNRMQKYTFSGQKNDDYQILVPIWGNIKYLENVEYLSKYGSHVTLCTTGDEADEFYSNLNLLATEYGFNVFIDKAKSGLIEKQRVGYKKRTTSGHMRDTIIRNALKTISSYHVVTLDADSTTNEDISLLVGELKHRHLDIASIRIVPSNEEASVLTRLQVFEYDTAMNFRYLCPWLISGACHVARTYVLENIMNRHSLFFQGNDVETGLLSETIGYNVGHIPFVVKTSVPANLESWIRQRLAWAGGEFRLYIMNLKFIYKHPFFWFYGTIITISMFPLRWVALSKLTPHLFIILGLYLGLIFYIYWKKKNIWLLLMPIYTLFLSLVMTPLGIIWYLYIAYKDKNYGIINTKR